MKGTPLFDIGKRNIFFMLVLIITLIFSQKYKSTKEWQSGKVTKWQSGKVVASLRAVFLNVKIMD